MPDFDYAVIGRGLMGSAAARHLASLAGKVALIGPEEPAEKKSHQGVFASHYDEGRITRTIDPDRNWARLANASIGRYGEIETQSGIRFYNPVGCLIAGLDFGNGAAYVDGSTRIAEEFALNTEILDDVSLRERFAFFHFEQGAKGLFERDGAGYISPRRLVAAQARSAQLNGAKLIADVARTVRIKTGHVEIETASGQVVTAAKVLVATGGFTIVPGLLPDPVDLVVQGRTVTLFELDRDEAGRIATMPSMIFEAEKLDEGIYLLPPITYPDGRSFLKIGADPIEKQLVNEADLGDWFRSDGDNGARQFLIEQAGKFVPGLNIKSVSTLTCVTSHTPTGYPAIGWTASDRIAVMAGGCGSSAKSSDEIGRLGARLLMDGSIADQGYDADFTPRFR